MTFMIICHYDLKERLRNIAKAIGVAEVKRKFSEYMSRTLYKGERFVIEKKGKPVAAMVSIEDLKKIEDIAKSEKKGLLAIVGAWSDFKKLDSVVDEIYAARRQAVDRKVKKLA